MKDITEFDPVELKPLRKMLNPHFLFNALSVIEYLSTRDSEKTKKLVSQFSTYLKGNFLTFDLSRKVSFDDELYQIQCFMDIELYRFDESLTIEYDTKVTEFDIPVLSIIKYIEGIIDNGLISRIGAGHMKLSSWDDEYYNYIQIDAFSDEYDDPEPFPDSEQEVYEFITKRIESNDGVVTINHGNRDICIMVSLPK